MALEQMLGSVHDITCVIRNGKDVIVIQTIMGTEVALVECEVGQCSSKGETDEA